MSIIKLPHYSQTPIVNAARLATLARAAYASNRILERLVADAVLSAGGKYKKWKRANASGIVIRHHDVAVLAIAGTNERRDWLFDLDWSRVRADEFTADWNLQIYGPGDAVWHHGFANYAGICLREAEDASFDFAGAKAIYLTGHSLGGAAATYLPWLLPEHAACRVVTFGAPRCSGYASGEYAWPLLRVVRNTDPFPMLPRFFFKHPGGTNAQQRYMRYAGDLMEHRDTIGLAMAALHWLNPSRCAIYKAHKGHSSDRYDSDLLVHRSGFGPGLF